MAVPFLNSIYSAVKESINIASAKFAPKQETVMTSLVAAKTLGYPLITGIYCRIDLLIGLLMSYIPYFMLLCFPYVYLSTGSTKKYSDARDMFCNVLIMYGMTMLMESIVDTKSILLNISIGILLVGMCLFRAAMVASTHKPDTVSEELSDLRKGWCVGKMHFLLSMLKMILDINNLGYILIERFMTVGSIYCWQCVVIAFVVVMLIIFCFNRIAMNIFGVPSAFNSVTLSFVCLLLHCVRFGPEPLFICRG